MFWKPEGIFPAMLTAFDEEGSINEEVQTDIIDFCIESGCKGIFAVSSAGEFVHMEIDEACKLMDVTKKAAKGRVPVVAGVTASHIEKSIEFAKYARQIGCEGIVCSPPYYYTVTQEVIERHYEMLAEAVPDMSMIMYNIPLFSTPLSYDLVKRVSTIPNVVAMKDSSGSMVDMIHFMDKVRLVGSDIQSVEERYSLRPRSPDNRPGRIGCKLTEFALPGFNVEPMLAAELIHQGVYLWIRGIGFCFGLAIGRSSFDCQELIAVGRVNFQHIEPCPLKKIRQGCRRVIATVLVDDVPNSQTFQHIKAVGYLEIDRRDSSAFDCPRQARQKLQRLFDVFQHMPAAQEVYRPGRRFRREVFRDDSYWSFIAGGALIWDETGVEADSSIRALGAKRRKKFAVTATNFYDVLVVEIVARDKRIGQFVGIFDERWRKVQRVGVVPVVSRRSWVESGVVDELAIRAKAKFDIRARRCGSLREAGPKHVAENRHGLCLKKVFKIGMFTGRAFHLLVTALFRRPEVLAQGPSF